MRIVLCAENDRERWDKYVADHSQATKYHLWDWQRVFAEAFGWKSFYLLAENEGLVQGILPLVWERSMFSSYLSSMPHVSGGGIVADNVDIEQQLLERAKQIALDTSASYIELRHHSVHQLPVTLREDKVGAVMDVPADFESLLQGLDKKTRNLVKKSHTYGMSIHFGGKELLKEFYSVYCHNMRDLGSPCYGLEFFAAILGSFPRETYLCVVRKDGYTVASAFLNGFKRKVEVMWASSYRNFLNLKPNMFLYSNLLTFAAEKQYRWFDFGRSSIDSGSYAFKLQWGARVAPLFWGYWLPNGTNLPSKTSLKMRVAKRIWQRMPVPIANALGPRLMRYIPGI